MSYHPLNKLLVYNSSNEKFYSDIFNTNVFKENELITKQKFESSIKKGNKWIYDDNYLDNQIIHDFNIDWVDPIYDIVTIASNSPYTYDTESHGDTVTVRNDLNLIYGTDFKFVYKDINDNMVDIVFPQNSGLLQLAININSSDTYINKKFQNGYMVVCDYNTTSNKYTFRSIDYPGLFTANSLQIVLFPSTESEKTTGIGWTITTASTDLLQITEQAPEYIYDGTQHSPIDDGCLMSLDVMYNNEQNLRLSEVVLDYEDYAISGDYYILSSEESQEYHHTTTTQYATLPGEYNILLQFDYNAGNWDGLLNYTWSILKCDLSTADVTITQTNTLTYNGQPQRPEFDVVVTVYNNNEPQQLTLTHGRANDYMFADNEIDDERYEHTNAGTYQMSIYGIHNFTGSKETTFKINKAKPTIEMQSVSNAYDGNPHTVTISITPAQISGTIYYEYDTNASSISDTSAPPQSTNWSNSINYTGTPIELTNIARTDIGITKIFAFFDPDTNNSNNYNRSNTAVATILIYNQ